MASTRKLSNKSLKIAALSYKTHWTETKEIRSVEVGACPKMMIMLMQC